MDTTAPPSGIGTEQEIDRDPAMRLSGTAHGLHITGHAGGVYIASGQGPALYAEAEDAAAVVASSLSGHGVHAVGGGVRGGMGTCAQPCGVFAEGGSGAGLYATGDDTAIRGVSAEGYGASLAGGTAPLRLVPAATAGAPASGAHLQGTLLVDAVGTLWLCVAGGSPGTWKRVVLQ